MEIRACKWFSESVMEDPGFSYFPSQISTLDYPIDVLDFEPFTSKNDPILNPQISTETSFERPKKRLKTNSWSSCTTDPITSQSSPSSSSHIISFEKAPSSSQKHDGIKPKTETESNFFFGEQTSLGSAYCGQAPKKVSGCSFRTSWHARDHVIAERKRREKLSQRFIALSAIVPGLKKMDKASVLGEAIKYLKHMQDRVKILEEQAAKKTIQSVVLVKKSQVYGEDESSSCDENFEGWSDQTLPEIEARLSGKYVLIRTHCENRKGTLHKILTQVEKFNLNVINTSVLPFGNSTIDVTIVAKVVIEFSMIVKEVVQNIRHALV